MERLFRRMGGVDQLMCHVSILLDVVEEVPQEVHDCPLVQLLYIHAVDALFISTAHACSHDLLRGF